MEATQTQTTQQPIRMLESNHELAMRHPSHDAHTVLGQRVRVRIECAPLSQCVTSYNVPQGVSELVIYESELSNIRANLLRSADDAALFEQAKKLFAKQTEMEVAEAIEKAGGGHRLTPEERAYVVDKAQAETVGSPEGTFRKITGGLDLKPLLSLEVLETLPPPRDLAQEQRDSAIADGIAAAMERVLSKKR